MSKERTRARDQPRILISASVAGCLTLLAVMGAERSIRGPRDGENGGDVLVGLLVFEIAGLRYALRASEVGELARAVTIVPLPKAPPIVEGVINVRGSLVPVLDVRRRFRLAPRGASHTDHLVLAWAGPRQVAVRADRALDFVQVPQSAIEEARSVVPQAEYLVGVAKLADGLVLIYDLYTFLQEAEAADLDAAIGGAAPGEDTQ